MQQFKFKYMTVSQVATLLGISKQEVRRLCREGRIRAAAQQNENAILRIETEQFKDHPNWQQFLEKSEQRHQHSMELAEWMLEHWSLEDDEEDEIQKSN